MIVEEGLRSQVRNIEAQYGRTMQAWADLISERGLARHGEMMAMLKAEYGVSHGAANRIALVTLDTMRPVDVDKDPEQALYRGSKASLWPLHVELMALIRRQGSDITVAPKKGYLSLRRRKQFAMIQPAAHHINLGLVLPGTAPTDRLESAATFNALFSHRVRVRSAEESDEELAGWVHEAYIQSA